MNRGELFPVSGDLAVFRPTHEGKMVLFLSLPAHSKLSDNFNAGQQRAAAQSLCVCDNEFE